MNLKDLYIDFFVSKGHKQIPSAPVVPENDPSVLFNTAGMQPLIPYLMGQPHPYGTRLCDYQKCLRTNDLDNIGDSYHHTFFEMLGNWSLGDYFKKEAITWSFEFLTKELNIPVERLAVTVFAGNDKIEFDQESYDTWLSLGIPEERIARTEEDNFWIAGETGPCDLILKCSILEVMKKFLAFLIQKMKDGLKFGMTYSCNTTKMKMEI